MRPLPPLALRVLVVLDAAGVLAIVGCSDAHASVDDALGLHTTDRVRPACEQRTKRVFSLGAHFSSFYI